MSSTIDVVKYQFNFNITRGEASDAWGAVFTETSGMTDDIALAFTRAFENLPWPAGTDATAFVTRHTVTEVQAEGDPTAGTFV